ncbi:MAG: glycosyltransferase [Gemmatimonadaceae bacterium]|nr:glycosyltransferase [Gemmatimonadaceae bacterium]
MTASLTVIVPAVNEPLDVQKTLEALARERAATGVEAIVVSRLGAPVAGLVRSSFPWAQVMDVPHGTTIPAMRALAFERVTTPWVAVIEDHVAVPAGWVKLMTERAQETGAVVGGPVDNLATTTLLDRAAFLCEYSHCMPPLGGGVTSWLPGNNVVYPSATARRYVEMLRRGSWENDMHEAIKAEGGSLVMVPEGVVGHDKHYSLWEYVSQRYLYSRSFAGKRSQQSSAVKRLAYAAGSLALPPVLLMRIVSRVGARSEHRGTLLRSLPLIATFVLSWAAGELVGYLAGPGDSLGKVR